MSADHAAAWDRLLASALLGTDRHPSEALAVGGALGSALGALQRDDREGFLLGAAGMLSLYRQAGGIPSPAPAPSVAVPPADREDLPRAGPRAARQLRQMLEGTFGEVFPEWLSAATLAGRRVPEELLPAVLDAGSKHRDWRESIFPVLGRRGPWLAALNADWAWALGGTVGQPEDAKALWQTGVFEARAALLKRLRAQDPNAARELLESTWEDDVADERAAFLSSLAVGLGMSDEPFLEVALDDKSKKVRAQAAELLATLPESRLVQRMIERLAGLLAWTPARKGVLARISGSKGKLEISLPEACDKAMQRDGLEPKPPSRAKVGEKAWWLQQLIACVPPSHWNRTWGLAPEALRAVVAETDWYAQILDGLVQATLRFRDPVWAAELVQTAAPVELLELLPPKRQESWLIEKLEKSENPLGDNSPLLPFLCQFQPSWSPELARAVLAKTCGLAKSKSGVAGYLQLRQSLKVFALRIPPQLMAEANAGWPKAPAESEAWQKPMDEFLALLQFRHDMREALKE